MRTPLIDGRHRNASSKRIAGTAYHLLHLGVDLSQNFKNDPVVCHVKAMLRTKVAEIMCKTVWLKGDCCKIGEDLSTQTLSWETTSTKGKLAKASAFTLLVYSLQYFLWINWEHDGSMMA
jgi:hypothetical protein